MGITASSIVLVAITATTDAPAPTRTKTGGEQMSAQRRAVLDASHDLAGDVSKTGEEFTQGRIDELRSEAQTTFDAVRTQLNRQAQERLREARDRISVKPPG